MTCGTHIVSMYEPNGFIILLFQEMGTFKLIKRGAPVQLANKDVNCMLLQRPNGWHAYNIEDS